MIQPFVGAHALLWFANADALNLLFDTLTILAVAVDEEDMGKRNSFIVWAIKAILSHFGTYAIPFLGQILVWFTEWLFKF